MYTKNPLSVDRIVENIKDCACNIVLFIVYVTNHFIYLRIN